jgi:hypothetical protein
MSPKKIPTVSAEETLLASLLADAVRQAEGRPGVLVRDLPLNPAAVLAELKHLLDDGVDLRIAFLNLDAEQAAADAGIPDHLFSVEVEQAERWRNEPGLEALIVVVSESDAAKLTSLEEFALVGPGRLRGLLVERAALKLTEINDVLPRWWEILGSDEQTSFFDLVDYFTALEPLAGELVKDQAALEINRLGLLPDPGFFDDPTEKALRDKLNENRSLALRLANFSEEDRQRVDDALTAEEDDDRRAELRAHLRDLQQFRRGGQLELTAADARQLLNVRTKKAPKKKLTPKPGAGSEEQPEPPPPPKDLSSLAVHYLLDTTVDDNEEDEPGGRKSDSGQSDEPRQPTSASDDTVSNLTAVIDELEETVRPATITVNLPSGEQIDAEIKTDVLTLVSRMVDKTNFGGLVKALGDDVPSMVRNFQQSKEVLEPWESVRLRKLVDAFADEASEFEPIRTAFDKFESAREALVPFTRQLCIGPLLVAAAPKTSALVVPVVDAYEELITTTMALYSDLHARYGDDAHAFLELVMLIDTIFLDNGESMVCLLTPLHPLLLWHYVEYSRVLTQQKDQLEERDRKLIHMEADDDGVPLFIASIGVPRIVSEKAPLSLPFAGKFGGLPQFSAQANARDPKDGVRTIRRLAEAFVDLHPSASEGLRLALLEPPDAGAFLLMACDLADQGKLKGAHITVLRRGHEVGAELSLSADEERRVQQRFGDHHSRRFTFESVRVGPDDLAPPDDVMPHLYVVFDQTKRHSSNAGGETQKVQPLANRRKLTYKISSDTLDLEPEPGGILAEYGKFAKLAVGTSILSYQSIHQSEELRQRLRAGAEKVPWYVVVDGHVDRDLDLGGLRVLTAREGTRDVAAFTHAPDAFRRSLREVVRGFNTSVDDDTLDGLLASLSELLDTGLMALRPGKSGEIVHAHVKGILGLMVAVKHLRDATPVGHDRVILSLDGEQARRWLHLNESGDSSRSDLLVIDGADDRFTVTIVEVKARRNVAGEYSVSGGVVTGPAINQMLSTYKILRRVFDPATPDLLLTPSRREVIREHLYRELSKASYPHDTQRRWAERSRRLFDDDTVEVDLRCELIDVQLGVSAATLEPSRDVKAEENGIQIPVALRHLNEDGVPGLEEALTPEPEPQPSDGEELSDVTTVDSDAPAGGDGPRTGAPGLEVDTASDTTSTPATPEPSTEVDGVPSRPRVYLGQAVGTYGSDEVWYDPQKPDEKLNNPHISITGETGTGKTQATKAILHELLRQGIPALILDFKDDYSKSDYAEAEGFTVHDASWGSLPFNPMVPVIDRLSGRVNVTSHLHELSNMLQRIYKLGDQQAFALREAMKETYEINGISMKPFVPSPDQQYLPFEAIREVLVREDATTLLGRLSPVFDLGLFSEGDGSVTLAELLATPTVIRLGQLPGDQVKNAVAEFFLMALHSFLMRREQPHSLRQVLVLDEAWRLVDSPRLNPLMLEGRAFGLGVIVATQFPKQLPDEVSGSTATRLFFGQAKAEQVREIQKTLVGKTSGADADHVGSVVRALAPLECVAMNSHYRPWVKVKTVPYFARMEAEVPESGD